MDQSERDHLIKVYDDTFKLTKHNKIYGSNRYLGLVDESYEFKPVCDATKTFVDKMDSFGCAHMLLKQGLNPVVLNMASEYKPGGGVMKGSTAQEECLFRRSDYYRQYNKRLVQPHPDGTVIAYNELVYTPKVTVIKDENYDLCEPWTVSCIACPAIRNPVIHSTDRYSKIDYQIMQFKIKAILQTAYFHEHDSVVLGALGCGSFHNPPTRVALMFKSELPVWDKKFKEIHFAILGDENYDIFKKIIV